MFDGLMRMWSDGDEMKVARESLAYEMKLGICQIRQPRGRDFLHRIEQAHVSSLCDTTLLASSATLTILSGVHVVVTHSAAVPSLRMRCKRRRTANPTSGTLLRLLLCADTCKVMNSSAFIAAGILKASSSSSEAVESPKATGLRVVV